MSSFHSFVDLPQELQDMVWAQALTEERQPQAYVFAMINEDLENDTRGWELAGYIHRLDLTDDADAAYDEEDNGEQMDYYSTLTLSSSSKRNFSAHFNQGGVEASCPDAHREAAHLERLGRLDRPPQSLDIVVPADPSSEVLSTHSRTVSIRKDQDLVVLVGDFMPTRSANSMAVIAPSPSWVRSVPFTWYPSPDGRVMHIGIEFDPIWLLPDPEYDWGPLQDHGFYDYHNKCTFTEAKCSFSNMWFIDRSIRRTTHGVIPPNRHIFNAKGGRFVEIRRLADGPKYGFVEEERVMTQPGLWEYQDGKPLDDFRRPNAFCFKDELRMVEPSGYVLSDNTLVEDLWKLIDRDDREYRDDLEGLSAGELAERTSGYGRLGVLAWEEGDF
ncbi:hypothetical protein QBC40DRAFT_301157 [Triangularia verruculosa]|uniref:Uncharacterized protein n=1 Tax=Triangularia verruculosa TaxID=2587418 RepID=A0AAN7AQJ9_9PEZI|nr:hypothetical protein QBC40DRAFT_301157 [Triangularia verruculosa]